MMNIQNNKNTIFVFKSFSAYVIFSKKRVKKLNYVFISFVHSIYYFLVMFYYFISFLLFLLFIYDHYQCNFIALREINFSNIINLYQNFFTEMM